MKRIFPALIVVAVAAISGLFLLRGAAFETPIVDEPPHITAGYSYLAFGDYRLNPEHPPFTKTLAALFLIGRNLNFPSDHPAWQQEVNGQWDLSDIFFYESGNDAQNMVAHARRGPIIITLVLILAFAWWAGKRLGPWWGVLAGIFLGFSPFILGHGNLVTTDVAAALGAFVSILTFGRYLEQPTWQRGLVAGLAFGFAQLCKFSLVLLAPTYLIVAVLFVLFKHPAARAGRNIWMGVKQFLVVAITGLLLVIYPAYYAFTQGYPAARQVRDTAFILSSFGEGATPPGTFCSPIRCVAEAVIWGAGVQGIRPFAEYALGTLMVVQRAAGGNTNYFIGSVSSAGSPLYFPVVYLLKETLLLLVLIVAAIVYTAARYVRHRPHKPIFAALKKWVAERPIETLMAAFLIVYWASSIQSSLNIGVRHLMPAIPLMYFLALRVWKNWHASARPMGRKYIVAAVVMLALGQAATAVYAAPSFLSYYNPLIGGTTEGYRYATDSNYDWGQDLGALNTWLEEHPEVDKIGVAYFGGGDVQTYLGNRGVPWYSDYGDPREQGIHWFATSISFLQTGIQPTVPGEKRAEAKEYRWLTNERPQPVGMGNVPLPDARVGTSMFIYRLP